MDRNANYLISIIIPAYNCEKYIERCIYSILQEALPEVEVLVVNDGSTDGTLEILEKYTNNVIVISKPNGGVSSARNKGIENAKGKYITFLDVDDVIPSGTLPKYLEMVKNYPNIELVQGCFDEPKNNIKDTDKINAAVIRKICLGYPRTLNFFSDICYEVKAGVHGCYGKLYNLSIIKNNRLRFEESLGLGEDLLFYFDYLRIVKEVHILDMKTYIINSEIGSATRSLNKKMPVYAMKFADMLIEKVEETEDLYSDAMYQINMHVNKAISAYFRNPLNDDTDRLDDFKKFLANDSIHKAYCYLCENEKSFLHKIKYWSLKNKYVNLYCTLEEIHNRLDTTGDKNES